MNKEEMMKQAEEFKGENSCFIHVEMKNGGNCEVLAAGDGQAIIYGIAKILHRISELTGNSFEDGIGAVKEVHNIAERWMDSHD